MELERGERGREWKESQGEIRQGWFGLLKTELPILALGRDWAVTIIAASCVSGSDQNALHAFLFLISFNPPIVQISKLRPRERKYLAKILRARWNLGINTHRPDS